MEKKEIKDFFFLFPISISALQIRSFNHQFHSSSSSWNTWKRLSHFESIFKSPLLAAQKEEWIEWQVKLRRKELKNSSSSLFSRTLVCNVSNVSKRNLSTPSMSSYEKYFRSFCLFMHKLKHKLNFFFSFQRREFFYPRPVLKNINIYFFSVSMFPFYVRYIYTYIYERECNEERERSGRVRSLNCSKTDEEEVKKE